MTAKATPKLLDESKSAVVDYAARRNSSAPS